VSPCTLTGVCFSYGSGPVVLSDVDLEVVPGRVHGIVGPNGSGKSTLLKLLAGLLSPQAGEVLLEGRPLATLGRREVARRVALVPQATELAFPFTVSELVLLGRTPHHDRPWSDSAADVAAARAALEAVGVLALAARPVASLSGGERQRVVVARALCQEPSLLLADEPTAHLDLRHQVLLLDLLAERADEGGLTSVVVLHDLNLASGWCHRVTLLGAGRIVATGPPSEVLTPERVAEVYGVEVESGTRPGREARWYVPRGLRGTS